MTFHQQHFTATLEETRAKDSRLAGPNIQLASDGLQFPIEL